MFSVTMVAMTLWSSWSQHSLTLKTGDPPCSSYDWWSVNKPQLELLYPCSGRAHPAPAGPAPRAAPGCQPITLDYKMGQTSNTPLLRVCVEIPPLRGDTQQGFAVRKRDLSRAVVNGLYLIFIFLALIELLQYCFQILCMYYVLCMYVICTIIVYNTIII